MVCEINYEKKEMSLSEYIKNLCEFENVEALFECVKTLKNKKSLDEIKDMDDKEMLIYFMDAEKKNQGMIKSKHRYLKSLTNPL